MRRLLIEAVLFGIQYVVFVRWIKPMRMRSMALIYSAIHALSLSLDMLRQR